MSARGAHQPIEAGTNHVGHFFLTRRERYFAGSVSGVTSEKGSLRIMTRGGPAGMVGRTEARSS